MSNLTELPDWVWALLDAVATYEDEHPMLYRLVDVDKYERESCFGSYLSEQNAWPPRSVMDVAEVRRDALRKAANSSDVS